MRSLGGDDYAILRLPQPMADIVPLKMTTDTFKSQDVIAAGYPGFDLSLQMKNPQGRNKIPSSTFTKGAIRFIERFEGRYPAISHDADIRKGNSGGPLVDYCGRVVGINTFGVRPKSGGDSVEVDFALSSEGVMAFLKENNIQFRRSDGECN